MTTPTSEPMTREQLINSAILVDEDRYERFTSSQPMDVDNPQAHVTLADALAYGAAEREAAQNRFERASETAVTRGVALDQISGGEIPEGPDDLCITNAGRYVATLQARAATERAAGEMAALTRIAQMLCESCKHAGPYRVEGSKRWWHTSAVCDAQVLWDEIVRLRAEQEKAE